MMLNLGCQFERILNQQRDTLLGRFVRVLPGRNNFRERATPEWEAASCGGPDIKSSEGTMGLPFACPPLLLGVCVYSVAVASFR